MKSGLVEEQKVAVSLEVNERMVKVVGKVTKKCALMQMLNGVLRIRQEAEDARRVLAEPAAHRPPVEPSPNNGGCDPGSGLPGLSMSKLAKPVDSLVGGCMRVPTSKSGLETSAHCRLT